ncbi:flagellar hook-associated family protein [Consotaella aegiceratis]|uniref:flagellar hook-associated family protein n=1 Tax=Consotaella aegiceratis TaxID=3097961 RepID=UPI002F41ACC0
MSISTLSLISAQRTTILRTQEQLAKAETEVTTGRYADVGATLGATTGQSVTLRVELSSVENQLTSNTLIGLRLDSMQDVLSGLQTTADDMASVLITGQADQVDISTLVTQAQASLEQLFGALNTTSNGQYLFAGTNGSEQPIKYSDLEDYEGSAASSAFSDAITNYKLTNPDFDLSTATAEEMQDFLDTAVSTLFSDDSSWSDLWSNANSETVTNKITSSESIDVSANANLDVFRNLVQGYAMLSELGSMDLSDEARATLITEASSLVNSGVSGLTELQADIGLRQERLEAANGRLESKQTVIEASISNLEDVDVYEASTRVTMLTTQLEAAYSLTAKLQDLSLLNYL